MELILASASPRRSEILKNAGFGFTVRVSDADETLPENINTPQAAVEYLSKVKAMAVAANDDEVILSADTVVSLGNQILGKPKDDNDAFTTLRLLSGKTHSVFTGVTLRCRDRLSVFNVKTEVNFFELSDAEILNYIKSGEPLDKAGSYGIQGRAAVFVEKINGDYLNVVGLPLSRTARELKKFQIFPKYAV